MNLHEFLTGIGFFAKYPYTDFHELNLDWAITEIARLRVEFDDFAHVNSLKYAGEWDITKSYSAFSVVDDHGFGYMALKPVPPGTQITDTEYWLMVVDYSQIINDYEARISALEAIVGDSSSGLVKDVDDLKTTVGDASSGLVKDVNDLQNTVGDASSGLVKDVDDLQTTVGDASSGLVKDVDDLKNTVGDASSGLVKDVDDLQSDVGILNTSVGALVTDVADIKKHTPRRFIILGDSYGLGYVSPGVSGDGWINKFVTKYGGQYEIYTNQNLIIPNLLGFAAPSTFTDMMIQLDSVVTDKDYITDIVVFGGTNDINYTVSAIKTGVETFVSYCNLHYPNANISIGMCGTYIWKNSEIEEGYSHCSELGCHYIHSTKNLMCDETYIGSDTVHLTQAGYDYYSPFIADAIINGETNYSFGFDATFTPSAAIITHDLNNIHIDVDQDGVTVAINGTSATNYNAMFDISVTTAAGDYVELGTMSNMPRFPKDNSFIHSAVGMQNYSVSERAAARTVGLFFNHDFTTLSAQVSDGVLGPVDTHVYIRCTPVPAYFKM